MYGESQLSIGALKQELDELKKMILGSRHERFIRTASNPSQLQSAIESEAVAQCSIIDAKKISYAKTAAEITEIKKDHPGQDDIARTPGTS